MAANVDPFIFALLHLGSPPESRSLLNVCHAFRSTAPSSLADQCHGCVRRAMQRLHERRDEGRDEDAIHEALGAEVVHGGLT
jgi:hypothetical protein